MNKLPFSILMLFLCISARSQEIPLAKVIAFQKDNLENVEAYLKDHGWTFESFTKSTDSTKNQLQWSHGKNGGFDGNGHYTANGWFIYFYADGEPTSIVYQYILEGYYKKAIAYLKQANYTLEKITPSEDGIEKIYSSGDIVVKVFELKNEFEKPTYQYLVRKKSILERLNDKTSN